MNELEDFIYINRNLISTKIIIDSTRKFWFVHFQLEFQLMQPDFFSNVDCSDKRYRSEI